MAPPTPSSDEKPLVPITLRIPGDIHGRLKKISEAEYRSLNHQIIMALTHFVEAHENEKSPRKTSRPSKKNAR